MDVVLFIMLVAGTALFLFFVPLALVWAIAVFAGQPLVFDFRHWAAAMVLIGVLGSSHAKKEK